MSILFLLPLQYLVWSGLIYPFFPSIHPPATKYVGWMNYLKIRTACLDGDRITYFTVKAQLFSTFRHEEIVLNN